MPIVGSKEPFDAVVAQYRAHELPTQKRRVADHHVGFGPLRLAAVFVQNRVAVLDHIQRLQDWVAPDVEAVAAHPLDLADPHRYARQFGGIRIDLNPLDGLWTDTRELAGQVQDLGLDRDPMLNVLEGQ